jgi:hypothetical protein
MSAQTYRECNTLKFFQLNNDFPIILKFCPRFIFFTGNFEKEKSIDCSYKLNKINACKCCIYFFGFVFGCCVLKKKKKTKQNKPQTPPLSFPISRSAQPSFPAQLLPAAHLLSPLFFPRPTKSRPRAQLAPPAQ